MNKNDLKKALKPLIKETLREVIAEDRQFIQRCIKESIFQEGTLSNIISECLKGTRSQTVVMQEAQVIPQQRPNKSAIAAKALANKERRRIKEELELERLTREQKLVEATGMSSVFEGLKEEILEEQGLIEVPDEYEDELYEEIPQTQVLVEAKEDWKPKTRIERKIKSLESKVPSALANIPPNNPGVNINGIKALVGDRWKKSLS